MNQGQVTAINQAIALLQSVIGKGGSDGAHGLVEVVIPQFDSDLQAFSDKSKTLSPEIQKLTSIYIDASKYMKQIMDYSSICKKFTPDVEEKLKQKFLSLSKDTEEVEKKSADHIDHARAIRELLSTTFWVFVPTPKFMLEGAIESADFNALKFQKKKNQDHNDWYKQISNAVRALQKFVVATYPTGLTFNFNGTGKWEDILSGNQSSSVSQTAASKPADSKEVKGQTEVKKQKKKELIGQNFNLMNYENEKIEFAEGQVQMKNGILLQNSKNVTIKIESKFKSMNINKCEGVILSIRNAVSGIEIVNCKDVKIYVHEKTPSISVDQSTRVRVVLNEANLDCDIVSSKASEFTISYQKSDGNQAKDYTVGEQLVTKWDPTAKKFHTAIYDKFL